VLSIKQFGLRQHGSNAHVCRIVAAMSNKSSSATAMRKIETCIQAQGCNQDIQPDIANSLTNEARYRILAHYSPDWEYWIGVDEEDHRRCFAVGMNDILIKPYDPQDLVRMLLKHFVSTRKSA
jgi:hypothetical protein